MHVETKINRCHCVPENVSSDQSDAVSELGDDGVSKVSCLVH